MLELLRDISWVLPLRHEWLTPLMRAFTLMGYEKFILFFLPLGYWAWDKKLFLRLLLLVAISALLNGYLKDLWQDPRPDLALRMDHQVGDSFGLPSGHAQIAVVLWLWLAYEVGKRWLWWLCGAIVAGIIFSRLYLGAHDLEDVLGGAALGALTLLVFARLHHWQGWGQAPAGLLVLPIVAVTLLCLLTWPAARAPSYVPLLAGLLVGVLFGYRLEARYIGFHFQVAVWRRLATALLGALAFAGLQLLLKWLGGLLVLPAELWQCLKGLLMGGFVSLLLPWVLVRIRLLPGRAAGALSSS